MKTFNPLEFALDFETKGTILYLKLAKKSNNLISKRLFYSLALQEVQHAKIVDEIAETLKTDQPRAVLKESRLPKVESELHDFFQQAKKFDLKKKDSNVSGYELAMSMERKGFQAYKKFIQQAGNEIEKTFFTQLMNQEAEHLDSIANVYYFLTHNDEWLQAEERKTWNWMNV